MKLSIAAITDSLEGDTMIDTRTYVIVDVADLHAGDVMLAWEPGDPCGPFPLVKVDRRPVGGGSGHPTWLIDLYWAHGATYAATGQRKITPRS